MSLSLNLDDKHDVGMADLHIVSDAGSQDSHTHMLPIAEHAPDLPFPSGRIFDSSNPIFKFHNDTFRDEPNEGPGEGTGDSARDVEAIATLTELYERPYRERMDDPNDFAFIWERDIYPYIIEEAKNFNSTLTADVHIYPELVNSGRVPRIIYLMVPELLPAIDEHALTDKILSYIPSHFMPTAVRLYAGEVWRSARWLGKSYANEDRTCGAKNTVYRECPMMGSSIGPVWDVKNTATLGGFLDIGGKTYGVSAGHPFSNARGKEVSHPSDADHYDNRKAETSYDQARIGNIGTLSGKPYRLRPARALCHLGQDEQRMTEMDWVTIEMTRDAINAMPVPNFSSMEKLMVVENFAPVQGGTEVSAMCRTSGHSLGFVSEVPGLYYRRGRGQREWSIRQYARLGKGKDCHGTCSRTLSCQTMREWVTSGIGVPGDSGAWVVQRSNACVVGLVWGRQSCYGPIQPVLENRLAYMTAFEDLVADIQEQMGRPVSLPKYTSERVMIALGQSSPVASFENCPVEPWNTLSRDGLEAWRRKTGELINRPGSSSGDSDTRHCDQWEDQVAPLADKLRPLAARDSAKNNASAPPMQMALGPFEPESHLRNGRSTEALPTSRRSSVERVSEECGQSDIPSLFSGSTMPSEYHRLIRPEDIEGDDVGIEGENLIGWPRVRRAKAENNDGSLDHLVAKSRRAIPS
jgi:hypothetical protein